MARSMPGAITASASWAAAISPTTAMATAWALPP